MLWTPDAWQAHQCAVKHGCRHQHQCRSVPTSVHDNMCLLIVICGRYGSRCGSRENDLANDLRRPSADASAECESVGAGGGGATGTNRDQGAPMLTDTHRCLPIGRGVRKSSPEAAATRAPRGVTLHLPLRQGQAVNAFHGSTGCFPILHADARRRACRAQRASGR